MFIYSCTYHYDYTDPLPNGGVPAVEQNYLAYTTMIHPDVMECDQHSDPT